MDTNKIINDLTNLTLIMTPYSGRGIVFEAKNQLAILQAENSVLKAELNKAQETIQTWIVTDKRYKELISLQAELKAKNQEIANLRNNKTH